MKLYKLFIPFALLICILTLKVSSVITNETYYINFKNKFTEELDIISLSKKFLGKLQYIYFDELDYNVSSNEEFYELNSNNYYVKTDVNNLVSKNESICISIVKDISNYTIKLKCEGLLITYYNVSTPLIKVYDYIKPGDEICKLNFDKSYYYMVNYEG